MASLRAARRPAARRGKSAARHPRGTAAGATLTERVYQALKRDLVRGRDPADQALSELALSRRYRASRTPVREAAVRLQQEGLLRIVPNRGYFVSPITINWLNQIYEYRAAIESACAELAARKNSNEALLAELTEQTCLTTYSAGDRAGYERFIELDTEFHVGIAQLTQNPLLIRAVRDMRSQMERIMFAAIGIGYFGEAPQREHREIISAIQQHQADRAREQMAAHIIASRAKVLRLATGDRPLF